MIPRKLRLPTLLAVATTFSPPARAAPGPPPDADVLAAARETFAAAERDEDAALWEDALVKLRTVATVRLTPGVRYHIALCEENTGRLVEALADYVAAEAQARAAGARDVLKLVGTKVADLNARVPRLTLRVVPEIAGAVVTVDGIPVDAGATVISENPGPHRVEARAPDRPPVSALVTLRERETAAIDLPFGDPLPPPEQSTAVESPEEPPPRPPERPRSMATVLSAGAGFVVLTAAGVGAFVAAGDALSAGIRSCRLRVTTAADACDPQKDAVRAWDWAAAGAWAGAAAAGALAVTAWVRRPTGERTRGPSTRVVFGLGSVVVGGTF